MIVPGPRDAVLLKPIAHSKLLLAEGPTPVNFFEALCRFLGLGETIEIRSYGGINQLHPYRRAQVAGEDFRRYVHSLLIARDAEDDAAKAKQSVQTAIDAAKLHPSVKTQIAILPNEAPFMLITKQTVAEKIAAYLHHVITLEQLVDWAENTLLEGEFDERDIEVPRAVVARLGVADVRAFGLTWGDCEQALAQLGYSARVDILQS